MPIVSRSGNGGSGGIPNPITTPIPVHVAVPTAQAGTLSNGAIEITSPSNENAAQGDTLFYIETHDGSRLLDIRDDGTWGFRSGDGAVIANFLSQDQTAGVQLTSNQGLRVLVASVAVHTLGPSSVGFFGAVPAAQPAAPVTLGDVIAALKVLGLVAT